MNEKIHTERNVFFYVCVYIYSIYINESIYIFSSSKTFELLNFYFIIEIIFKTLLSHKLEKSSVIKKSVNHKEHSLILVL